MTRTTGLILVACGALALAMGARAAETDTKKPAPAPHAAAAAPKPPVAAPKPMAAGTPGLGAKPGTPARPGPAVHAPEHAGIGANPGAKGSGATGPVHREAGPAGAHGTQPHEAAFRPRELARDDPARAHGRFDEQVHDAGREQEIARLHEHDFHVRDVRHFHEREWSEWRGGHWHRDFYNGRYGWWYDVAGVWYAYAAPVYPYPLVVAPLVVDDAAPVAAQPVAEPDSGPVIVFAPLPAMPHVAYHCAKPVGFYPAVALCDTEWVTIAAH